MKTLINIIMVIILISYLFVTLSFVTSENKQLKCKKISIYFDKKGENNFIDKKDIINIIKKNQIPITGIELNKIDRDKIEKIIENNKYVKKAEAYFNTNHEMIIEISPKEAVFRVITNNENYFVDSERNILPVNVKGNAHVHIVLGDVSKKMAKNKLFNLISKIRNDNFWNAQVDHLVINKKNEVDIFVKVGIHRIRFGKIENIDDKFRNILAFYKQGMKYNRWDKYKLIDARFKNQIVCEKN